MSKKISIGPIKKRVVLYINHDGIIRFPGWALTTTTLGTMAEPYQIGQVRSAFEGFTNVDPSDPAIRIDELMPLKPGYEDGYILSGERITGGNLMPRVFKKTGDFV